MGDDGLKDNVIRVAFGDNGTREDQTQKEVDRLCALVIKDPILQQLAARDIAIAVIAFTPCLFPDRLTPAVVTHFFQLWLASWESDKERAEAEGNRVTPDD